MTSPTCIVPGKIMLAGEYAVIDDSPAIMLAVNRYAIATVEATPQKLSPFLAAAHQVIAKHFGETSTQAKAARAVRVDTHSFREGNIKLGLGSSAAATVAAVGASLGNAFDTSLVHTLARQAHGDAQAPSGTRGSGADVASCTLGACIRFAFDTQIQTESVTLPDDLHLVFPWCGRAASTTALVPIVRRLRESRPSVYKQHIRDIAESAKALGKASLAEDAIVAIDAGGNAVRALGNAAQAPLWLPIHEQMRAIATELGGALKPTGAGGGDLALAAFANSNQARLFVERLAEQDISCPRLAPSQQGVRLQGETSKVTE